MRESLIPCSAIIVAALIGSYDHNTWMCIHLQWPAAHILLQQTTPMLEVSHPQIQIVAKRPLSPMYFNVAATAHT